MLDIIAERATGYHDISVLTPFLEGKGYEPLILRATKAYVKAFGGTELQAQRITKRRIRRGSYLGGSRTGAESYLLRYAEEMGDTINGDLFVSSESGHLLFALSSEAINIRRTEHAVSRTVSPQIVIGYMGDDSGRSAFEDFKKHVTDAILKDGKSPSWNEMKATSLRFNEINKSGDVGFSTADSLTDDDFKCAGILSDNIVREVSLLIKRSGAILGSDLIKKTSRAELAKIVSSLLDSGLISLEYAIICQKTSNYQNRMKAKETIEKMSEIGVLCSCGRPIAEERIEELYGATPVLQKLLDQSHWMTVRLVQSIQDVGVGKDRVILNMREGSDEVDAFVDVEGALTMFELKDDEFSLGHAYSFGARIGLHKPDFAVIVSTKGISTEVKEHFKRVTPSSELHYADSLEQLPQIIREILRRIRKMKADQILGAFEDLASVEAPIAEILSQRIDLDQKIKVKSHDT